MKMTEHKIKHGEDYLVAENITVKYDDYMALDDVSMSAKGGEFVTLLGPSGSGKSTLLYAIGGLVRLQHGNIRIGDKDVTSMPIQNRNIGFVFQNYALFPHLSVAQNVAFALKARREPASVCEQRVKELLELVSLQEFANRAPAELSGGQQQRVALARALAHRPEVLLLDEPMGALDYQLRRELGRELKSIQKRIGTTAIYVTHDPIEAMLLSDRVITLHNGRIEQSGSPEHIYRRPRTLFVAQLLGEANKLGGKVVSGTANEANEVAAEVMGTVVQGFSHDALQKGQDTCLVIRPENLLARPADQAAGPPEQFEPLARAHVLDHFFLGDHERVSIEMSNGTRALANCHAEDGMRSRIRQPVDVYYRRGSITMLGAL